MRAGCRAETVLRARRRPDGDAPPPPTGPTRPPPLPLPAPPEPERVREAGGAARGGRGAGGRSTCYEDETKSSSSFKVYVGISSLEPRKQYISHLCMHIAHVHVVCFESTVIGLCLPVRRGVRLCADSGQCGVWLRRDPGPCVPAYARAPQESPESATTHTATIRVH